MGRRLRPGGSPIWTLPASAAGRCAALDSTGSDHSGCDRRLRGKQVYATLRHFHPGITIDRQGKPEVFPEGLSKVAHGIEAAAELTL